MLERISHGRLVPVIVLVREDDAQPLAEALLAGGLDIMITRLTRAAIEQDHCGG